MKRSSHTSYRYWTALTAFSCLWGFACASPPSEPGVRIHVEDSDGNTPVSFTVTAAFDDGTVETVLCPDPPETDRLSCFAEGMTLSSVGENVDITVRSRGFAFVSAAFRFSDLQTDDGRSRAVLSLTALPPFSCTEDYCSGFPPDNLDDFTRLAHITQSEQGPLLAVKFYMRRLHSLPEVYFINTQRHALHYEFVRDILGMTLPRSAYDLDTYFASDRDAMAGTLILYPSVQFSSAASGSPLTAPMVLTFFPSDTLTPEMAATAHRLLEERLGAVPIWGNVNRLVYVPAGSVQEQQLTDHQQQFDRSATLWATRREMHGDIRVQILNAGEAVGTLRHLSPEQLTQTVVSFNDILLLTRLPADLPIVAGTITEELQTPLSHVNVAARARGTPNIALLDASEDATLMSLIGRIVRFTVREGTWQITPATEEDARAFRETLARPPVTLWADLTEDQLLTFAEIDFEDSIRVGSKAANTAELWSIQPDTTPYGMAVPFFFYHQFMETTEVTHLHCALAEGDCAEEGRSQTLCRSARDICTRPSDEPEILGDYARRLLSHPTFQTDTLLREALLDGLRIHIRHAAVAPEFATTLDARVQALFGDARVRLRSSTNAEDLADFSGAGLYTSVGAGGAGRTDVPSADIRKVWASIWNFRAFEERRFWGIDHESVYMGVLIHPSFPDEAANGVLITVNPADPLVPGYYVNVQPGEYSVTNPQAGHTPEMFTILPGTRPGIAQVSRLAFSSLSPDAPVLTDLEIILLYQQARAIQTHFAGLYDFFPPDTAPLELEFKFNEPNRSLIIKQVRPYLSGTY